MNTRIINREYSIVTTIVYFLSFIFLGIVTGTHGPCIPEFASQTSVSLETISIVFSAISAGYLLGSYISARTFDTVQGHKLISFALLLMAVSLYCSALVEALMALVILSFGVGMAKSILNVGCNTLLVWVHGKSVAPFMNALHFFFGLGAFIGPILVTYSINNYGSISGDLVF